MADQLEPWLLPDDLPYYDWVTHVFDHPILELRWWFHDSDSPYYQEWHEWADYGRTLEYLTRLFREPEEIVARFSREEIDQGLNFLVNGIGSNYMSALTEVSIPWQKRKECIDALTSLYEKLIAPVYGNDLGGSGESTDSDGPTFASYMFWDIVPLHGGLGPPDGDRINDAVLDVFEQVLTMKAESCLESVLHGLGHWHHHLPERTEAIVRQFLKRNDISKNLRSYAETAAVGRVL